MLLTEQGQMMDYIAMPLSYMLLTEQGQMMDYIADIKFYAINRARPDDGLHSHDIKFYATASDKVYQLLAHGRWFSPASSTTKTGRRDIAEILLKVALSTKNHLCY